MSPHVWFLVGSMGMTDWNDRKCKRSKMTKCSKMSKRPWIKSAALCRIAR